MKNLRHSVIEECLLPSGHYQTPMSRYKSDRNCFNLNAMIDNTRQTCTCTFVLPLISTLQNYLNAKVLKFQFRGGLYKTFRTIPHPERYQVLGGQNHEVAFKVEQNVTYLVE